ncbi:hypothetical protein RDI58_013178 [Solanum bulbocastanum]|uniref:Uncharacterized protein n=1 Tax=Solanum bulbocastanum TaxID=147425 RepID=A0AAN8TMC7_SOLBU
MDFCDHHIFRSGMPYTDSWPCGEMNVISQFMLRVVDENLIWGLRKTVGVETPPYPMAGKSEEESQNLHLAWCYEMVQLEFEIATLEANMRTQKGIVVDL